MSSHESTALQLTPALTALGDLAALLDRAREEVERRDFVQAFRLLGAPLSTHWASLREAGQAEAAKELCASHPLMPLVRQDPYTLRAAVKPRGYAGDAVLLDFLYGGAPPAETSRVGRGVFQAATRTPMGLSVLFRRDLLRSYVDDAVSSGAGARILSVAAGHCREVEGSLVERHGFDGEFVALDQDALSCEEVAYRHRAHRVQVLNQSVRDLMAGEDGRLGAFDLVYSAGLYDYLPDPVAQRLTARLLRLLRPGGRLLVANFLPGGSGRGYMELFMDWTLIVRSQAELQALCVAAGAGGVETFVDPHRNVVYAEMVSPRRA